MDAHEALLTRRTIHNFTRDEVPEEAIERALQAALRAPNHKLTNPWRFTRLGPGARKDIEEVMVRSKTALDRADGVETPPERIAATYTVTSAQA